MEIRKNNGKKTAAVLLSAVLLAASCGTAVSASASPRASEPADAYAGDPLPKDADVLAEQAAREVLGAYVPLTEARTRDGFLFTCLNGYALVDPVRGCVTEYALSPGEVRFPEDPEEGIK